MATIVAVPNRGRQDILIILGPDNIERMKEKDPFELKCWELPRQLPVGVIQVVYASDAEIVQMDQLARQGKTKEVIDMATSGFKYRPEMGDHDLGPQRIA